MDHQLLRRQNVDSDLSVMWSQLKRLPRCIASYYTSSIRPRSERWGRWLGKGLWAVMDQGLFATSNFLVNLLLARWLIPQDYGIFTVAFTITLFTAVFHQALLTEPMLVFGPGRFKNGLSEYLGILVYGHIGFAALSSLSLMAFSLVLALSGSDALPVILAASALAAPFISLLWLMRRACYVQLTPHLAALGGGLYVILMLGGTWVLYWRGWLSAISAFGVMGVSSLIVSLWLAIRLQVNMPPLRQNDQVRDALKKHWEYGRWSMATAMLQWTPANIYYLLLPIWVGFEASASLKALMNLLMPVLQTNAALSAILLPILVQAKGHSGFHSRMRFAVATFILGSALYWILLGVFNRPLVSLLYEGKYLAYADMLWLLGLLPVASGVIAATSAALRAMERPDQLFRAYVPPTIIALTLGILLVFVWGTVGAAVALVLTYVVMAMTTSLVYRRVKGEVLSGRKDITSSNLTSDTTAEK
jgi:O-antigen/teichoic acid export membrane protein